MEHKDYVIHYRNLQFIESLGAKITEVKEIVEFDQKDWMASYIQFNTERRKEARNDFEKEFFKLMNNSVFGKTMEQVKNMMKLHITTDEQNAKKWFSKINLKGRRKFDGMHLIEMYHTEIEYDKPLYVGSTILDLSKLHMMDFHYNVIEKNFKGRYHLCYTDTDSFIYSIQHDDIYEWIKDNRELFDLSGSYREDMRDRTNAKVLGKFKDEKNGLLIKEVLAMNPKVYSLEHQHYDENGVYHEDYNTKKLKGLSKVVVKKNLKHEDYNSALTTDQAIARNTTSLRSFNHNVYTYTQTKVALTSWCDKMVMLDSVNGEPFGYKGCN